MSLPKPPKIGEPVPGGFSVYKNIGLFMVARKEIRKDVYVYMAFRRERYNTTHQNYVSLPEGAPILFKTYEEVREMIGG